MFNPQKEFHYCYCHGVMSVVNSINKMVCNFTNEVGCGSVLIYDRRFLCIGLISGEKYSDEYWLLQFIIIRFILMVFLDNNNSFVNRFCRYQDLPILLPIKHLMIKI